MSRQSNSVVMKFGGTSVGSAARMEQVVDLVAAAKKQGKSPVVVLSAMSGVTNLLIEGADKALQHNLPAALEIVEKLRAKHIDAINASIKSEDAKCKLAE
ncbi:MAG: hypothetical protein K2X81_12375, partial [Candidatus Obscuribacterales bacterium]|nr:hypothetical protein [Candidatus Obscuribacterales bacterium]